MGATTNNTGDTSVLSRITITSDRENVRVNMENCSGKDILVMCGALQQVIGVKIAGMGDDCEDIAKSSLLDIHLAAMEAMSEQLREERRVE